MGLSNFFSEVVAGRGMEAVNKEANRVGGGVSKEANRLGNKASAGLRYGEKVAGEVKRFGDKVSSGASMVQNFTSPIAMATGAIPVVGNIASGINSAVGAIGSAGRGISSVAGEAQNVIKTGDKLVRSGRSLLEAKSGDDIIKTARDINRAGREQYKSSKSLLKNM